jgi:RNA polymerase sigma factor (sigma-70 family)
VTDEVSVESGPDRIGPLLEEIRMGTVFVRETAARELLYEVHQAIYPMCLKMLDNADDAYETVAETMARLLARVGKDDDAVAPIDNATAYVRSIARNVCNDLHRASRRRHDRSAHDLYEDELVAVADHASTMNTPVATPTTVDKNLIRAFGYTSKRALADLSCLSEQELKAVILRQEGYSYIEIAAILGDGLSPETARTHGERGMHKLRGLAHVGVWRQEPLASWSTPPCPQLAKLKVRVTERLEANATITAELYQQIGKHLAPKPDRGQGGKTPVCQWCGDEAERSKREYWWLLVLLLPFPLPQSRPALQPVGLITDTEPAGMVPAGPASVEPNSPANPPVRRQRNNRKDLVRSGVVALVLLLLIIAATSLVTRAGHADETATGTPAGNGRGTTPASASPASSASTRNGPAPASTEPSTTPGGSDRATPNTPSAGAGSGPQNAGPSGAGSTPDVAADPGQEQAGPGIAPSVPSDPLPSDPCPGVTGGVRAAVGPDRVICWYTDNGAWRPLDMSGLQANAQPVQVVPLSGGQLGLFFTATDNYIHGTKVNGNGDITGWYRFFDRNDHYYAGFNIDASQPVLAMVDHDYVYLFAVGLDEVVWYLGFYASGFANNIGWQTLLDTRTFWDGGRFYLPQTLARSPDGHAVGLAKDNLRYKACAPGVFYFRWVPIAQNCPPLPPH